MRRRIGLIALVLSLALLAGCAGPQQRRSIPVTPKLQAEATCGLHILNFTGQPLVVMIRRLDGPGMWQTIVPSNQAMTEDQFLDFLRAGRANEIRPRIIPGLACGKYEIMAPTLQRVRIRRICNCKNGQFNETYYLGLQDKRELRL